MEDYSVTGFRLLLLLPRPFQFSCRYNLGRGRKRSRQWGKKCCCLLLRSSSLMSGRREGRARNDDGRTRGSGAVSPWQSSSAVLEEGGVEEEVEVEHDWAAAWKGITRSMLPHRRYSTASRVAHFNSMFAMQLSSLQKSCLSYSSSQEHQHGVRKVLSLRPTPLPMGESRV